MTLGKKIASYRKVAGLTQAQLGEQLSISPQAVSKWENDLSEPDIATLQTLAKLYKVSLDTLLDPDIEFPEIVEIEEQEELVKENESEEKEEKHEPPATTIGFCKRCGIVVNEENLGATEPVIMCKKCVEAEESERVAKRETEERKEKAEKAYSRSQNRRGLIKSFIFASLVTVLFVVIMIFVMTHSTEFVPGLIPFTIIGSYVVFAFVSCLFFDCIVQEILFNWTTKSFQFPGLIFSFDLDGFIWLIAMKILFWILGAILGLLAALIGIAIGMVFAIFVFPYIMIKMHIDNKNGEQSEFVD